LFAIEYMLFREHNADGSTTVTEAEEDWGR
jgi:hypothetical protein